MAQAPRKSTSALNVDQNAKKILRIGVVQNGRIVEEKLLRKGGHVTIGRGADNVFLIPSKDLPRSFKIFEETKKGYILNFAKGMDARLAMDGKVFTLNQMLERGENLTRSGEHYQLDLASCSRGKLVIGEVTILFHFVVPPPELPRPQLPHIMWGIYALRNYLGNTFITSVIASVLVLTPALIFLIHSNYDPNWKPKDNESKKFIAKMMAKHSEQVEQKEKKIKDEIDKNAAGKGATEAKKDPNAGAKVAVKSNTPSKDTGPVTKDNVANKIASDKGLKNLDKMDIKVSDNDLKAIKNLGNVEIPSNLNIPQTGPIVANNVNVGEVGSSVKETVVDGPCTGATCSTQTHGQFKVGEHTADNEYGSGSGGKSGGGSGLPSGKLPKGGGVNTNINVGVMIDTNIMMVTPDVMVDIMIAPVDIMIPSIMTGGDMPPPMSEPIVTSSVSGLVPPGAPLALRNYLGSVKGRVVRCFQRAGAKGLINAGTKTVKVCASVSGGNFSITSVTGLGGGFPGCVTHSRPSVLKTDADKKFTKSWCFTMHLIAKSS